MEYAVKPLTSEDAEYMEERIDEFDDGILPPEPDAPETARETPLPGSPL